MCISSNRVLESHALRSTLAPEIVHPIGVHDLAEPLQQSPVFAHNVTLAFLLALRLLQLDGDVRLGGRRSHIDRDAGAAHFAPVRLEACVDPRLHKDLLFFGEHDIVVLLLCSY